MDTQAFSLRPDESVKFVIKPSIPVSVAAAVTFPASAEDDVDPCAVVLKNIPFAVKTERQLMDLWDAEFSSPKPFALSFLADARGYFSGIAFANFRCPEDASSAIDEIHGKELMGRKLRAEKKRVSPQRRILLEEEARQIEEFEAQLIVFCNDSALQEFEFPNSISSEARKKLHFAAERLGLGHRSEGEGAARVLKVTKPQERPKSKRPVFTSSVPTRRFFTSAKRNEDGSSTVIRAPPRGPDGTIGFTKSRTLPPGYVAPPSEHPVESAIEVESSATTATGITTVTTKKKKNVSKKALDPNAPAFQFDKKGMLPMKTTSSSSSLTADIPTNDIILRSVSGGDDLILSDHASLEPSA